MPRPMKGVPEKSKDFKGSTIKLFKSLIIIILNI